MKKISVVNIGLVLILSFSVFGLTACSGQENDTAESTSVSETSGEVTLGAVTSENAGSDYEFVIYKGEVLGESEEYGPVSEYYDIEVDEEYAKDCIARILVAFDEIRNGEFSGELECEYECELSETDFDEYEYSFQVGDGFDAEHLIGASAYYEDDEDTREYSFILAFEGDDGQLTVMDISGQYTPNDCKALECRICPTEMTWEEVKEELLNVNKETGVYYQDGEIISEDN